MEDKQDRKEKHNAVGKGLKRKDLSDTGFPDKLSIHMFGYGFVRIQFLIDKGCVFTYGLPQILISCDTEFGASLNETV